MKWWHWALIALIGIGLISSVSEDDDGGEDDSRRAAIVEEREDRQAEQRQEARAEARKEAAREKRLAAARRERQEQEQAEPQPAAEPEPTCDTNYEGACLDPNASDYDCQGGEGDGPKYTGPLTVVGSDHYGLDENDGDPRACELVE
jgi:hypothetical protein